MDDGCSRYVSVFYIAITELRPTNANNDPDISPPQYAIGYGCIAIINIHYGSMIGRIASEGTVRNNGRRTIDTDPAAENGRITGDKTVCDSAQKIAIYAATG